MHFNPPPRATKPLMIVANWKMNLPSGDGASGINAFRAYLQATADHMGSSTAVVCPPYPYLATVFQSLADIKNDSQYIGNMYIGAQNLHSKPRGSFTGEVSGSMLAHMGARYVIVGHAERRKHFCEDLPAIQGKLKQAFQAGLTPILCVGESALQRKEQPLASLLAGLLHECLTPFAAQDSVAQDSIVVAYEPIWAIGATEPATSEEIQEALGILRHTLGTLWGESVASRVPLLYGGSLSQESVAELSCLSELDGFLVGRASLDLLSWIALLQRCSSV